jgi:hypothetical protein
MMEVGMRVDVIILSDLEAEVHYLPGCLMRWLFGSRHTFSPIVRVSHNENITQWVFKHTRREVPPPILHLLERLPASSRNINQQLLLAAAAEADQLVSGDTGE